MLMDSVVLMIICLNIYFIYIFTILFMGSTFQTFYMIRWNIVQQLIIGEIFTRCINIEFYS